MKKTILICAMGLLGLLGIFFKMDKSDSIVNPVENIYNLAFISLEGDSISLNEFKGNPMLLVNTASACGFTPQYEHLQELHSKYPNLTIIGFPCNQFGAQESGSDEEIKSFCQRNYGVSFLMSEKIDVKGENQHPIYTWLTQKEKNGKLNSTVKWNFQKYLIDKEGRLIDVFYSTTNPLSEKITKHLN